MGEEERAEAENPAEESSADENAPDNLVPAESSLEETVPEESAPEEIATEESTNPEETTSPEVPSLEEAAKPPAKAASVRIDLAGGQDGDGYTFTDDMLTIHESGAYQITGGSAASPLPLGIRVEADASVELEDVGIASDAAMTLAPDVKVLLLVTGASKLSSAKEAGISVPQGALLTINGSGDLTVQGGVGAVFSNPVGCAGIGTGVNMAGGSIVIAGGNISAYGGDAGQSGGAGIGTGGSRGNGNAATLESIEIRSGTVFAQGGESAAGIGTGVGRNSGATTIGSITIGGGSVTCSAGSWGAEIGTGEAFSSGISSIGTIEILGGTITATAMAEGGAAIGTGEAYNSSSNTIGLIRVAGGMINVTGGPQGAGIGSGMGYNSNSLSRVERLEIHGGLIHAQGGAGGAGIGSGLAQNSGGVSSVGEIFIGGGSLKLRGGTAAACIGSGQGHSRGISGVDSIVIQGGNIDASNDVEGFEGGAGIGSGEGINSGQSIVGSLAIRDGIISAVGGEGAAAIGTGDARNSGVSRVDSIEIDGGMIYRASGGGSGAGVGAGFSANSTGKSTVGSIRITGGELSAEGGDSAPAIGTGVPPHWSTVDSLDISGATVIATAGGAAPAIHLETGHLAIESSASVTAFAKDNDAISPTLQNAGNGRLINASFDELDGDFAIHSTDSDIRLLLPYPFRYFAVSGSQPQYSLVGGYSERDSLHILDVTDPDDPLDVVLCGTDFSPRKLAVAEKPDGHMVEYRANGASGSSPDDPTVYHDGETVTVMGRGELYMAEKIFAGWNTRPDGNGAYYSEGDRFVITKPVVLYAQWSGHAAITAAPDISFGESLPLPGRNTSFPFAGSEASLTILAASSGWRLTASLGGFSDSFGSHNAIPGGAVILTGGAAESAESGRPPWIPGRVRIISGGGAAVIAQADAETGSGSWTFRWINGGESGIALHVPAGEGSVGPQTAAITWSLENVP